MSCIILLAEDDVVVRNSARLLLQAEGHDVLVATDGHEALKLSREYQEIKDLPFLPKLFSPSAFRDKVREVLSKPHE